AIAGTVGADEITAWLAQRVPAAMVPARILVCAALPLTVNGKIDRQALFAAAGQPAPPLQCSAPAEPDARPEVGGNSDGILSLIFDRRRGVLLCSDLGPDDDFFASGGDSIMAIQIVGRARAAGVGLTPTQIFLAPTPRALSKLAVAIDSSSA